MPMSVCPCFRKISFCYIVLEKGNILMLQDLCVFVEDYFAQESFNLVHHLLFTGLIYMGHISLCRHN